MKFQCLYYSLTVCVKEQVFKDMVVICYLFMVDQGLFDIGISAFTDRLFCVSLWKR